MLAPLSISMRPSWINIQRRQVALNATEVHTTHRHVYVATGGMMSLQAAFLAARSCAQQARLLLQLWGLLHWFTTDWSKQTAFIGSSSPHDLLLVQKHMWPSQNKTAIPSFGGSPIMGGRLLCLTSFYFVELMLTWVFFFFLCNSDRAGAWRPWRGQSHYLGWRSASWSCPFFFYRTVQEAKSI